MIDTILMGIFVLSCFVVVYHHIGYPVFLRWYSKHKPIKTPHYSQRGYKHKPSDHSCASITLLIPAYNEERWIADKIRNVAALDYPKSKLKVIIACDGCCDNTVYIAQQTIQEAICSDTHFEIIDNTTNMGKVAIIEQQMDEVNSDITAFSDVSCLLSVDALWIANQHFLDSRVGVLHGCYQLLCDKNSGECQYWQYQNKIIESEAAFGAVLGAHGAFYLFRTTLYPHISANTINDDFVIPMEIVRSGYRAVYDHRLVAIELEATTQSDDFKRRLRISAGNMQQLLILASLFLPKYRITAFAFFSSKGLRVAIPYLLFSCLLSSILLSHHLMFNLALMVQIALYVTALLTHLFPFLFNHKLCKALLYIVAGHAANFIGGLRYLLGMESQPWSRIGQ